MAKFHIVDIYGQEMPGHAGEVFNTEEEAEDALDSYQLGRETEDYLAEFESDPADRLDYMMNPHEDDDYFVEEIVEE